MRSEVVLPEWPEGLVGFREIAAARSDLALLDLIADPNEGGWAAAQKFTNNIGDLNRALNTSIAANECLPLSIRAASIVQLAEAPYHQRWIEGEFEPELQGAAANRVVTIHLDIVRALDASALALNLATLNKLMPKVFKPIFSLATHFDSDSYRDFVERNLYTRPNTPTVEANRCYRRLWNMVATSLVEEAKVTPEHLQIAQSAARVAVAEFRPATIR